MTAVLTVFIARLLTGATARWTGCAPDIRQRVYFANHTSNLDAVVVWAVLPATIRAVTRPVAAHDYWTAKAWRRYLAEEVFHALLIERKRVTAGNNPIDHLTEALKAPVSLVIFPEGTRNPGPEIGSFKSGLYHLARRRPDLELVPVYIDNMNRILPKGEFLPLPLLSSVSFGTPLYYDAKETKQEFLSKAKQSIEALRSR